MLSCVNLLHAIKDNPLKTRTFEQSKTFATIWFQGGCKMASLYSLFCSISIKILSVPEFRFFPFIS